MADDVFGIVGTTQAGSFHVEQVVAEGGFGVVYRAQHGGFRAPVALKCLKVPESMTEKERALFLEKFREEGELMFRLSAAIPEVVRPLQIDVLTLADGRFVPFLALEWLDGETLDGIIARRHADGKAPIGLVKAIKLLTPIARAVARAHHFPGPAGAVSIVHRDLKPENIFVTDSGGEQGVKILDFGIAKAKKLASEVAGRTTGKVPEDDVTAFSPAYGSPEQWLPNEHGEAGPWTDVWGLAITLVEVLAGKPAIEGELFEMRYAALDLERRPTPVVLGAAVPAVVEQVFTRALAVDPGHRFRTVERFWSALERAAGLPPSLEPKSVPGLDEPSALIPLSGLRLPPGFDPNGELPAALQTLVPLGPEPEEPIPSSRRREELEPISSSRRGKEPEPISSSRRGKEPEPIPSSRHPSSVASLSVAPRSPHDDSLPPSPRHPSGPPSRRPVMLPVPSEPPPARSQRSSRANLPAPTEPPRTTPPPPRTASTPPPSSGRAVPSPRLPASVPLPPLPARPSPSVRPRLGGPPPPLPSSRPRSGGPPAAASNETVAADSKTLGPPGPPAPPPAGRASKPVFDLAPAPPRSPLSTPIAGALLAPPLLAPPLLALASIPTATPLPRVPKSSPTGAVSPAVRAPVTASPPTPPSRVTSPVFASRPAEIELSSDPRGAFAVGGYAPPSPPPHAGPAPPRSFTLATDADRRDAEGRLKERLRAPVALVVLALAIMAVDLLASRAVEHQFMVGPIRPLWVAGPLALLGAGLIVWRLLIAEQDG